MLDYREMNPCERVVYYRSLIYRMTPPQTQREVLLIEAFQLIIVENESLCQHDHTEYKDE